MFGSNYNVLGQFLALISRTILAPMQYGYLFIVQEFAEGSPTIHT